MSEEFKRSAVGHDANDLHKHGDLGATPEEEKTERESLEDAIEALNESEETENLVEIEKDMKADVKAAVKSAPINEENSEAMDALLNSESAPAESKNEPANAWKVKENKMENETTVAAPAQAPKEAKKGGMGWKIATIACLVLAIAGCGLSAYMLFGGDKVELMGRTVTKSKTEKKVSSKTEEPGSTDINTDFEFDFDSQAINYKGLLNLISGDSVVPIKIEYTKDGKYIYAFADIADGIGGYAGAYYREAKKGSSWNAISEGHDAPSCATMDAVAKKFITDYKYIDDDLDSRYIGCYDESGNIFPE